MTTIKPYTELEELKNLIVSNEYKTKTKSRRNKPAIFSVVYWCYYNVNN